MSYRMSGVGEHSKIVNEIKAQHVATNGLKLSDLLFSRIDQVAAMASRFPRAANY